METLQWIISAGTNIFDAIQLNHDLSLLRTRLPKARLLIDRAEWGSFKNKELAVLLSQLKDTTYDAEDLLREFDDQVLRKKIEDAHQSRAGQLLSSSLNLAKSLIHGSKTRVQETQSRLDKALAEIEGVLSLLGLNVEPVQLMPETSSVIGAPEVLGRDEERDLLIEMLGVTIGRDHELDQVIELLGVPLTTRGGRSAGASRKRAAASTGIASTSRAKRLKGESSRARLTVATETNCTGNVSILAIFGIGGVGKTTLAQFIYNDARVKAHFGVRIWVCVSDLFNKRRITKEIIESISGKDINPSRSLDALQGELMEQLENKKFLLVLDDIWANANDEWEAFYAPLRHGLEGSMVLVTTRFQIVADLVTTIKPVELKGLPADIFWEFFKKCAFGRELPESYPQLQDIGQSIANRLCGSPLGAQTLGRLLNMELTEQHWRTIQNSELWEPPHRENEILLPALQLSYLYLPQELKKCFAFCSMFPKGYSFERDVIVDIWVAQGFVPPGGNVRLEDMGSRYLDDLRSRFLFQPDPKFPAQSRYVMHDLIHDMAQSVSVDECFLMQDLNYQNQRRIPHTVRHISIEVNNDALSRMGDIQHLNKLHSLRFGTRFEVEVPWFNLLSNILFLSLKGCNLVKLPESICVLSSLRYLDISHSSIQELPEKFRCLHSLQVFDANRSGLQTIHQDVTKLVNLRRLALPARCSEKLSTLSGLGNLSCLRNLSSFTVGKENGRRIFELKGMNELTGRLSIRSIANVQSMEEAAEARLVDKQYLKELVLNWRGRGCSENGVLEALRPPSRIEELVVEGFGGDKSPSWLNPKNLPTLMILEVSKCFFLRNLSTPFPSLEQLVLRLVGIEALTSFADGTPAGSTGDDRTQHGSSSSSSVARLPLTRLSSLRLYECGNLTSLDQFLSPEYLPSIKSIEIDLCGNLVSLPVHKFVGFVCLQDLKIQSCGRLVCPREMVLPPSLRRLSIHNCGELDKSFPGCLENLTSLTLLELSSCFNVESIPLSSIDTSMLKFLLLRDCRKLSSIGGLHALSSIQHVKISSCCKLTEIQQPFQKKGLWTKEKKELIKFVRPSGERRRAVTINPSLNVVALPPAPAPALQQEKQERLMGKQPVNYNTLEMESDKRVVLQRTLSSMHDLIEHAECWVHKDAVSTLLRKAKDAVYCAEDILDELNYHELQDKVEGNTVQSQFPEFSDIKMEEVKGNLDHLISQMGHLGLHDRLELFYIDKSISLEANLFPEEQTIFGREKELELIDLLDLQENTPASEQIRGASMVPEVLPIVGRGGVGKTTLAHRIVSEKRVRDHFDLLIWLSVSDGFDEKKLIKRLISSVAESEMKSDDLSGLQRILSNGIIHHSRRFLLVLDDVQEDVCREDCHRWKSFLDPLKCAKPGSTVLVITRSLKVANAEHLGTKKPLVLEGLPEETLWEFFRVQAFRSDYSNSHPVLERIGRSIVARLNGSPLGAKILGRLLSLKLDAGYWNSILESELWELPHQEEISIGPALELSYQYLPFHLKRCFSFCSMYPKDYQFDKETLLDSWIAVGLVEPYQSTLAVHVGHVYFQQIVNRSFFQKAPTSSRYVMHDFLHEMAQLKSRNECFVVKGRCDLSRIPPNVHHLSVHGNSGLSISDLESLHKYKTLRSVVCICVGSDIMTTTVLKTWFCHLTNIRMLRFISSQLEELPDNVGNLIHLRYLDISACDFDKLPDSFWRLYKLEILDALNCKFNDVPKDIIKLINLQRVRLKGDLISQFGCVPEIGKLALLQEMPYYTVDDKPGRGIQELKNMIHLQGRLEISGLRNVMSKEQAAEAALYTKIYLHTLILSWHESIRPEKHNSSQEMEVLEGLRPSSNIKHLEVKFYMGTGFHPSWLREDELSSLASLSINSCPNVAILFVERSEVGSSSSSSSSSAGFQSLTKLSITWCRRLKSLDNLLRPEYLPAIKAIRISNCEDLVSLPTESLGGFVHLEDLEVSHCWSLNWEPGLALPRSLKALRLEACGEFSDPTLSCLRNLAALATLDLQFCPSVESIPAQIWSGLPSLENLKIFCCQGLNSIGGGSGSIARVKNVDIRRCPKLEELEQPFRRGCYC